MTGDEIEIDIDRLSVRLTGTGPVEPPDVRRLAELVAAGLAPALRPGPGDASIARLRVEVRAPADAGPAELADRIVDHLAPLINRVLAAEAGR
jgi:hypothetical protein